MAFIPQRIKALWNGSLTHRALLVAPPALFVVLLGFWVFRGRPTAQYYTAKVDKGDISQVVTATAPSMPSSRCKWARKSRGMLRSSSWISIPE